MKLIAATRVLNEDDVIEAMIRHHAAFVDHHVIIDNGSSDRTLEIIAELKLEGLALTVLQNPVFADVDACFPDLLYAYACQELNADWVLCLDADEFLAVDGPEALRSYLADVPEAQSHVALALIDYLAGGAETAHEVNLVRRLTRRSAALSSWLKVMVRSSRGPAHIGIGDGNHFIRIDGIRQEPNRQDAFRIAHYPARSPVQWAGKAVAGWVKVLATGMPERWPYRAPHYAAEFDDIATRPQEWLQNAFKRFNALQSSTDLIEDPLCYLGGDLRYTETPNYEWRALSLLLANVENLARSHGRLLDRHPAARTDLREQLGAARVLLGPEPVLPGLAGEGLVVASSWRRADGPAFQPLLGAGWSDMEAWGGVWGVGPIHELNLILPGAWREGVEIEMEVEVVLLGPRNALSVEVMAGQVRLATWRFDLDGNRGRRKVEVPLALLEAGSRMLRLELRPSSVARPCDLDPDNGDDRPLGVGLRRIRCLPRP